MLITNATIVTGGSPPCILPWHLIFGSESSTIITKFVAGKILMENRRLTTLDEAQIAARARELSSRVSKRSEENTGP